MLGRLLWIRFELHTVSRPKVAGSAVSVRELADPSTVKMGKAASPSAGCSEVDVDVVQIEATLRIAAPGHRHLLLCLCQRAISRGLVGAHLGCGLVDLGRPAGRISHAVDEWVARPLATSGISCGVYLLAVGNVEKLRTRAGRAFDMATTVRADRGRTGGPRTGSWRSQARSQRRAHPSL